MQLRRLFTRFARMVATLMGHPVAFILAVATIVIWAAMGPFLHFSETWQLVINTATTILTFLMVFLLQHTQNHDSRAVQVKLDELLRAVGDARNELIDLENLPEDRLEEYCREFQTLHRHYAKALKKRGKLPAELAPGRGTEQSPEPPTAGG